MVDALVCALAVIMPVKRRIRAVKSVFFIVSFARNRCAFFINGIFSFVFVVFACSYVGWMLVDKRVFPDFAKTGAKIQKKSSGGCYTYYKLSAKSMNGGFLPMNL